MHFDHERLDVDQVAPDFLVLAERLIAGLPRGLASEDDHRSGKDMLFRIANMLVKLARSLEKR